MFPLYDFEAKMRLENHSFPKPCSQNTLPTQGSTLSRNNPRQGILDPRDLFQVIQNLEQEVELLLLENQKLQQVYPPEAKQQYQAQISQLTQANQELQQSQARLTSLINLTPEAIITIDSSQRITLFNRQAEQLFGYRAPEILGKNINLIFSESSVAKFNQYLLQKNSFWARNIPVDESLEIFAYHQDRRELLVEVFLGQFNSHGEMILTIIVRDISDRYHSEQAWQQINQQLRCKIDELEQRHQEMMLLAQMSDFLQACQQGTEAYAYLPTLIQRLFEGSCGHIFVLNESDNLFESVGSWGEQSISSTIFTLDDCWALRRSRPHGFEINHSDIKCKHIDHHQHLAESFCIPMMAQGKALGLLSLHSCREGILTTAKRQLAITVAEHIALALANLKLREELHIQSIRDPLTGLFNRRYLEESLRQSIHWSKRKNKPLGLIMLDIDHFKRFNDTFGHEAGDLVLQKTGAYLQAHIRGSDVACRYGGEEIVIIMAEASLADIQQRAEQLRQGIKNLKLSHHGKSLGTITASFGIASFPDYGSNAEDLLAAADDALYQAKAQGRDCVVTSH